MRRSNRATSVGARVGDIGYSTWLATFVSGTLVFVVF